MYFTDQKIEQMLNFESLECKDEINQRTELEEQMRKCVHLFNYHVYFGSNGCQNVKYFLYFLPCGSKKLVTI